MSQHKKKKEKETAIPLVRRRKQETEITRWWDICKLIDTWCMCVGCAKPSAFTYDFYYVSCGKYAN